MAHYLLQVVNKTTSIEDRTRIHSFSESLKSSNASFKINDLSNQQEPNGQP